MARPSPNAQGKGQGQDFKAETKPMRPFGFNNFFLKTLIMSKCVYIKNVIDGAFCPDMHVINS